MTPAEQIIAGRRPLNTITGKTSAVGGMPVLTLGNTGPDGMGSQSLDAAMARGTRESV